MSRGSEEPGAEERTTGGPAHDARPPVVVIGAGAAGTMAAIHAASAGAPVLLLEGTKDGGRKILISGGGRCNVLPSRLDESRFVTASSPNSMRRLLRSWPLEEQRRFFEARLGIALALEPETGKLFPVSNRARDVRDRLLAEARTAGARLRFETRVTDVEPIGASPGGARWLVRVAGDEPIGARSVVIATGGLSVPQTGSDGVGLRIAAALGHTVRDTYPALTPLTAEPPVHAPLAGVSLDVTVHAPLPAPARGRFETTGGFLFTHRGYSGPTVLNASHHAVLATDRRAQPIRVQWTGRDAAAWERLLIETTKGTAGALLRRHLPSRLADMLIAEADVPDERTLAELRREERARLVEALTAFELPWTGDEGYRKAEVTGGGVALEEIDPRTLESRVRPGLYLCGEVLDAFGPIGGYNFAWAWATGRAAGEAAGRAV